MNQSNPQHPVEHQHVKVGSSKPFCTCNMLHAHTSSHRSCLGWVTTRSPTLITPAPCHFRNPSDPRDAQGEAAGSPAGNARDSERSNSQPRSPTRSQGGPAGSCAVGTSREQPSSRHRGLSPTMPRWEGLNTSTGTASEEAGTNP